MKYLVICDLTLDAKELKKGDLIDLPFIIAQLYLLKGYISEYVESKEKADKNVQAENGK